jgi:hypothetical protein
MKELFVRLRGRPDSEHEMSFNRVAFGVTVLIAVLAANPNPGAVGMLIAYCVGSVIVFFQIARDSAVRPVRRLAVMAVDFIVLSYVMHANSPTCSPHRRRPSCASEWSSPPRRSGETCSAYRSA